MKIVIMGSHVEEYLKKVVFYLGQNGRRCTLKKKNIDRALVNYDLEIHSFENNILKIACSCIEISFGDALKQLDDYQAQIKESEQIINIIPIKCFPALRYNVDEYWKEIDSWVTPEIYQKKLDSQINASQKSVWILQGIENVSVTNDFFRREENIMALESPSENSLEEIKKRFFAEIGETEFEESVKQDFVFFGFALEGFRKEVVGERAMCFWILASFSKILPQKYIIWDDKVAKTVY